LSLEARFIPKNVLLSKQLS